MPKGGSRFKTSRPKRTRDYYASKDSKKHEGNSGGHISKETNPLENSECFGSLLPCSKCNNYIVIPEAKEKKMSMKKKKKLKCTNCGGKHKIYKNGIYVTTLLPYIVIPLIRIK